MGELDDAFSRLLAKLDGGDRSAERREKLAWCFAAQAMRDPEIIASYTQKSQTLAMAFVDALDAPPSEAFAEDLKARFPGVAITRVEFKGLLLKGQVTLEAEIEAAIDELGRDGGTALSPRTDVINELSGRQIVETRLLSLDWPLQTSSVARSYVLGDSGLLFDTGSVDDGLRVPLSPTQGLYLTPMTTPATEITDADATDWSVAERNLESAARSRRWIVGAVDELEHVRSQGGNRKLPRM